ncbi:MAG: tetratricopeptide repeat protein [Candidatus Rokubacteria bacterium]|nr:tetratricopeptide repeat protein [Candidatus Rokubacteria bacterium]
MKGPLRAFGLALLAAALAAGCIARAPKPRGEPAAGPVLEREQVAALLSETLRAQAKGDLPSATGAARRALAGARRSGWSDLAADAHFLLGEIFGREALPRQSAEAFAQAYDWSRRANDRPRGIRALNALANVLLDVGDYDRAFEASSQALRLARSTGDLRAQSTALNNIGETHRFGGRYAAGMDAYKEALTLAQRAGTSQDVLVILENMASTARRQGQLEEAAERYDEAIALARRSGTPEQVANLLNTFTGVRLVQQRPADAWLLAREAVDLSRSENLKRPLPRAIQNEGLAAWAMGDRETARRALTEAARLAGEMDDRQVLAYSHWHLGRLALESGDRDVALAALDQALRLFRGLRLAEETRRVEAEIRAAKGDQP